MGMKNIGLLQNHAVKEVLKDKVIFENGEEIESDLTIMIPIYKGQQFLIDSKLGDEKGFLPTDEGMRHLDHKNIFGAGDLNALTMPKLGHLAVKQADIVTAQLLNEVGKNVKIPKYEPEILCIMNMGGSEA
jgi:sulfide:quinone oxidoreductase